MIHISLEGIVKTKEDEQALITQISNVCQKNHVLFEMNGHTGTIFVCPCGVIDLQIDNYYAV